MVDFMVDLGKLEIALLGDFYGPPPNGTSSLDAFSL
jgi:hypothetical protein